MTRVKLSELKRMAPAEPVVEEQAAASAEEPWGVVRSTTPSGLEIYYQAGPKRLYRVRTAAVPPEEEGGYPTEWGEVPSASTVLGVLEKGGLSWWGMGVGVDGVLELIKRQKLDTFYDLEDRSLWGVLIGDQIATKELLIEALKAEKLTVNHVKDKAADRGTNVHSALELYAETGTLPNPENYPANEAGYVRGLVAFLQDTQPVVEHSELMVASTEGFAGRFDLVASLSGEAVVKTYPKRADVRQAVEGRWLLDLKTSKGVYPSYHLQLAGYEGALQECGYGTVDHTGVVRVTDDGRYELVAGRAYFEDFLAVLSTYQIIQRLEGKE